MTEQVDSTATTRTDGINMTPFAAAKVKSLLEQEGRDDLQLRIAVQPGGCSAASVEGAHQIGLVFQDGPDFVLGGFGRCAGR